VAINNMIPTIQADFPSFAISETLHLILGEKCLNEWTVDQIAWALIHEVSHPLRNHFSRAKRMGVSASDAAIVNACQDAEINDDFPGDPKKCLPEGFCWLPADLDNQEPGKLWEEYYNNLPKNGAGQKFIPGHPELGEDRKDQQGPGNPGARGTKPGLPEEGGQCGSGATGVPVDGEPEAAEGTGHAGKSEAEISRIREQVAAEVQNQAQQGRGSVPAGWLRWSEEYLKPPTIPWQQKLRRAARRGFAHRAGQTDYRYDRPSRRQWGVGIGPGHPILPRMYAPIPVVKGAFDTSGSMDQEAIRTSLSEWKAIMKELSLPLEIYACDAAVHSAVKVRTIREAMAAMRGGGGTDFRPIFKAVKAAGPDPDVLAIFTDGDGPAPEVNPLPRTRILWVLVDSCWGSTVPYSSKGKPVTYGEIIRMDPPSLRNIMRILVKVLHPENGKGPTEWEVKRQYITTYKEYCGLSSEELAYTRVAFLGDDENPKEFDRSAEYD